ncbi:MAG: class I SAM-dependent methyltransferase [Acidobacteria bacterium]|nr:class I SAM-dependent methyltransferase [Acidobacteriota bacterium]
MRSTEPTLNPRWNEPEQVADFAAREPDLRLVSIVDAMEDPGSVRFLDLGCAAGRNTVFLAERGCDVHATDLSRPMVEETTRRLATTVGKAEALRRVHLLPMTDLSRFTDRSFDFIIALGIYQQATSLEEWDLAIGETARVLRPGGLLLVAHFGVGTDLTGRHGHPIESPNVYEIREGHPSVLFDAAELDARLADHGFDPLEPTETVTKPHEGGGQRVTLNAFHVRRTDREHR